MIIKINPCYRKKIPEAGIFLVLEGVLRRQNRTSTMKEAHILDSYPKIQVKSKFYLMEGIGC